MRFFWRFFFILLLLGLTGGCAKKEEPVTEPVPITVKDPRTDIGDKYTANAKKLAEEAQFRSSNFYLGKAIELFTEIKNWEKAIQCYIDRGNNYRQLEEFEKARQELDQALDLTKNQLGYKHLELAKSFSKLGYRYLSSRQYDLAIEMYDKALLIQLEILGKDHPEIAKTYNSIALAYWNKGDSQKAHENYNKSFSIKLRQFQGITFDVQKQYRLLEKKDIGKKVFSSARQYFNRSLAAYRDTYGTNDSLFAAIYENIGILYAFEGDYTRALEQLRRAFSLRLNIYGDQSPEVASSYHNIGVCLRLKGDYKESTWFLENALKLKREVMGKDHPDTADIHYQLGKIYFHSKSFAKALSSYQRALSIIAPGFSAHGIYKNPRIDKVYMKDRLLKILAAKAETLKARYLYEYDASADKIKDLRFALSTYLLIADLIEDMRRGYKSESYKLFFGEKSQEIYDQAIQTALLLYEMESGRPYKYKETAFLLCEKSKAAVLAEALAESRARRFAGIPDQLLEKEKNLRDQLNLYDTLLEKEYLAETHSDPGRRKNLENRYFDLKDQYQRMIEYFENRYPKYYQLKYNPHPVTVSSLQQALTPRTAVIEYFVGKETMNIFVLTRDKLETVSIPIDKDFNRIIETFYLAIKKIEADEFLTLSRQLYQLLMESIRHQIADKRKLVIIPHGQLYYVPFEALVPHALDVKKPSAYDYMIKHFTFSYHYSARLWLQTFNAASDTLGSATGNISFIGFAPVFDKNTKEDQEGKTSQPRDVVVDGKRFPRLPGTEKEVQSIMKLFQSRGKLAKGYFHQQASEDQFKSAAMENYSIIHVATHSLNNFINPKLSGLLFTQSPPASAKEDGVLYSGETYNLNLNAELIVLSSCESGIGKLVKGEGMIALNRGFLYSGVRNTIFSLWKVEDKTTSRLMIELYRDILAGKTFAASLKKAKLKLIQDPFTAFPKYWSGFILVGE